MPLIENDGMTWVEECPGEPMKSTEARYHHDDVVQELRSVLADAKAYHDADHGLNGFTCDYEVLRDRIDTALAKLDIPPQSA